MSLWVQVGGREPGWRDAVKGQEDTHLRGGGDVAVGARHQGSPSERLTRRHQEVGEP